MLFVMIKGLGNQLYAQGSVRLILKGLSKKRLPLRRSNAASVSIMSNLGILS